MDILSHTATGVAVGTVVAPFDKTSAWNKLKLILLGGFAGALPDLDAFSLWSKFDAVVGSAFGLSIKGSAIYFGKYLLSHHGAWHSLFTAAALPILWFVISYLISVWRKAEFEFHTKLPFACVFLFGFSFHLLEDMPTPACVWGGVRFWSPSESYVGGWGQIWWWNNYDIFLIICSVIVFNSANLFLSRFYLKWKRWVAMMVFGLGFALAVVQMSSRQYDYAYSGFAVEYTEKELESKREQQRILGATVYAWMLKLDNAIPLNF